MGENPVENEEKFLDVFWNWKKNDDSLFTKNCSICSALNINANYYACEFQLESLSYKSRINLCKV